MIVAGTGHRPERLSYRGLDGYAAKARTRLEVFAEEILRELNPSVVVSGMALGWDQALAEAAVRLGIRFTAAWKFQRRNEYLVTSSNLLVALWNGESGGTANCLKYATERVGRKMEPMADAVVSARDAGGLTNVWDRWIAVAA